jgi:hypothetical protein
MKPVLLIATLASLAMTGCSDLLSVDPIATKEMAVKDANLVGAWTAQADDSGTVIVRQKDAGYEIQYVDGESVSRFRALVFRVGNAEFLDVTPQNEVPFSIAGHALVRVWTSAATLRWAYLDSEWLRGQAGKTLESRKIGKQLLVTSPGDAVLELVKKFGADDKAHGDIVTWNKL